MRFVSRSSSRAMRFPQSLIDDLRHSADIVRAIWEVR